MSSAEATAVADAYQQHLSSILPRLPMSARVLACGTNVHDATIRRVVHNIVRRELHLDLRCGDRQMGYYDVDLVFFGTELSAAELRELAEAVQDPRTEILYSELDLEHEAAIYRLLFWPYRESVFRFRDAALRIKPQSSREFSPAEPRFAVVQTPVA